MAVENSPYSKYLLETIIVISCSSIYLKKYSLHSLPVILVHGYCKPYSVKGLMYHINEINKL